MGNWRCSFFLRLSFPLFFSLSFLPLRVSRAFPGPQRFSPGGAAVRCEEGRGGWASVQSSCRTSGKNASVATGVMPFWNKPDLFFGSLLLLPLAAAMVAGVVVVGEDGLGRYEAFSMGSLLGESMGGCGSLFCRWILSSSSTSTVAEVVGKEWRWSTMLQYANRVGADPRWCCSRRSYGVRFGVRWPVFTASPSTFLAEWRPSLFLPAMMPKGRQRSFFSESMAYWCCGACGVPSGLVPGDVTSGSERKWIWTQLQSTIPVRGPFCKVQGLVRISCFFRVLFVICTAPPL